MKITKLLMFFAALYLFTSCEVFRSDTPISNSENSKILNNFSGEWILLDQNDTLLHPLIKLRLIPFNEHEYIATALFLSSNGRSIKSVDNYRAFISDVSGEIYFNVKELSLHERGYFFVKIEEINENQVEVQHLLDSFSNEINKSIDLRRNLELESEKIRENYLSDKFTYYRHGALNWDKINILYNTDEIVGFYKFTRVNRSVFINYSDYELRQLIPSLKEVPVNDVIIRLNDLYLSTGFSVYSMMKFPVYSIIEFKSGRFIKLAYDQFGSSVKDITNDQNYFKGNADLWSE